MFKLKIPNFATHVVPIFLLVALCFNAWSLKLPDINWGIALTGFSPIDWVSHLTHPENFARDFSNGTHIYDKSSFMYVYPLAQKWLDISPEHLIPVVILFEIFFLAACSFYFCRTIAPDASLVAACFFALLVVSSYARDMNLANFGAPFFWGLFYNVADGLRLVGIALLLRGRVVSAAVLFAASLTVHPVMALIGCAFASGYLIVERRVIKLPRLVMAGVLFSAIVTVWLWFKFRDANMSSGAIDSQTWIDMARMFSSHFFPVDYGWLTIYHDARLLPLLCLLAVATFYLPRICTDRLRCQSILAGLLLLGGVTALGLLISVYMPVPALIKLALPRASDMLILVALTIAVTGLVAEFLTGALLWRMLAFAILLSPFVMNPGFPAIPVLLLVMLRARAHLQVCRDCSWLVRVAPLMLCATVVLSGVTYWMSGIVQPQHWLAYVGHAQLWWFSVYAGLGILVFQLLEHFRRDGFSARAPMLIILMVAAAWQAHLWQGRTVPNASDRLRGTDYLAVQRWTKTNTPSMALFMVDPTIYYGWRDFSSRSSFGNLREWLHTSWLYDSRVEQYAEGWKRFNELGIDITPFLAKRPSINGFIELNGVVKQHFYSLNPQWFVGLAERYGIDYLVLSKKLVQQTYPFEAVYENSSFIVYKLPH